MSIIPTALGGGQRLDQLMMATDVFDTPGTSSWIHPSPGTALEVQVILVGGAGGGAIGGGGDGTNGTNTIWDYDGTPIVAGSGSKAISGSPGEGFLKGTETTAGNNRNKPWLMDGLYGNSGYPTAYSATHDAYEGGSGYINQFRTTVTNDVNLIVGSGGVVGSGANTPGITNSQNGAVIVSYAKAAVGIPAPVQKEFVEEWLDYDSTVSGSGTWSHPRPGHAITMTVIAVGGGSGGISPTSDNGKAGDGGDTIFSSVTANGATSFTCNGSTYSVLGSGLQNNGEPVGGNGTKAYLPYSGYGSFGSVDGGGGSSYSGHVSIKRITVTSDINYTIGEGGSGFTSNRSNGLPGGIILKYSY